MGEDKKSLMDNQRLKLVVKLKSGEQYNFITEPESVAATLWRYDKIDTWLIVRNDNETTIQFPFANVESFFEPIKFNKKETVTITEISKNVFEISDYIKHEYKPE